MTEHVDNAALLRYLYLVSGVEYTHAYDGCLFTCCFFCLPLVCLLLVVCLFTCCLSVCLLFAY